MKPSILLAAASALALSACGVGPDYATPQPRPAMLGQLAPAGAPVTTDAAAEHWWKLYDDPVLDGLVADALAANTDIRVASARLDRARAALRGARSDRLPQTNIGAGAQYSRTPDDQRFPGTASKSWAFDTGLDVSYEVDLFGRVSRNIEAARGDIGAAQGDADAVRVGIVAEVTRAYVEAAATARQAAVIQQIVDLLDHTATITQKRFDAGRAERLDILRIQALRDQRKADRAPLLAERQAAIYRLALLTGRAPDELPGAASLRSDIPQIDRPIPIGDGAALLARRPDIRAAERRLSASTARVGVATADLYPRITLGGSVGSSALHLSDLFGGGALRFLLGPLISWNFPNQEATRARIAGAKADTAADLATFDGTVLRALQETDTALSGSARAIERCAELANAQSEAARAVAIVRARQREGRVDFLAVLDAERTNAEIQAELADAETRVAAAQIDVFRALGGGWQAPVGVAVADTSRPVG